MQKQNKYKRNGFCVREREKERERIRTVRLMSLCVRERKIRVFYLEPDGYIEQGKLVLRNELNRIKNVILGVISKFPK